MSKRSQQIEALFQQGQRLYAAGRLAEAERIYRQVLAEAPLHADALHALGALALQAGHPDAAHDLLAKAVAQRPAAAFLVTQAHALLALRRPRDAEQCCRLALRSKRNDAEAYQALGHALSDSREPEAAIEAYRHALRLKPALPDIHNNLGVALRQANRLEDAEQALIQAPKDPAALLNLSGVQKERAAFDRAEATLRQALSLTPGQPVLHYNWSLLMLLLGRTREAWPGWEQRFRAGAVPGPALRQPQWQGDELGDRRLLVHAEQGFGDTIQFCRYLPAIAGHVTFDAPPRLVRLLAGAPNMPTLCPAEQAEFDVVVPLLSLPARIADSPMCPPYLLAEADRVTHWRTRIGPSRPSGGISVGIAWQGYSGRHEDAGRSLPLTAFRPLAELPGVRLISLQKGEGEDQIATAGFAVETLTGLDNGPDAFVDTGAVMMLVDLVVTSDTSIAHLAGALGRPVWVALRRVPDWRWMLDRLDSPWYPTMRLFRQSRDGDWDPVFAAITQALRSLAEAGQ